MRELNLKQYKFNAINNSENHEGKLLESELIELKSEFSNIQLYVDKLGILDKFSFNYLLNYYENFSNLTSLHLNAFELPLPLYNLIFKKATKLNTLILEHLDILIDDDMESVADNNGILDLPTRLNSLIIKTLGLFKIIKTEFGLINRTRESYTFNIDNLMELKSLEYLDRMTNLNSNLVQLINNNNDTINSLTITDFSFNLNLLDTINSCKNLTKLIIANDSGRSSDTINVIEYPKFPQIQNLTYKAKCIGYNEFNKQLLLSFPNLTQFTCSYEKFLKKDLVTVVNSLIKLETITLFNGNSNNNFDFNINSNSLREINLYYVNIKKFTPVIADECPNLNKINLVNYELRRMKLDKVTANFNLFTRWKYVIFDRVIRMYSTLNYK